MVRGTAEIVSVEVSTYLERRQRFPLFPRLPFRAKIAEIAAEEREKGRRGLKES